MKTEITVETHAAENPDAHTESPKAHNLEGLTAVLEGEHGLNVKGRLLYSLNFAAQRVLRQAVKSAMSKDSLNMDELAEKFSMDEISQYFGFETTPEYTVDQCCNWVMATFVASMDIAKHTEANERGEKSKPYAWIAEIVRNPVTMITHDAEYGIKQSMIKQRAEMSKLGMPPEMIGEAMKKFEINQRASSKLTTEQKVELVLSNTEIDRYKRIGTDELHDEIAEMCATLGLNIPQFLKEIANRAKDSARERALQGKYIGEMDTDLLALADNTPLHVIGSGHAAAVEAETAKTKEKQRRRVTAEQAAQQ